VELHCHSNFSFLDGASTVEELVFTARALKMQTIALTDHDGLYGAPRFFKCCKEEGIKPIIGTELTLKGNYHVTLLAKDRTGYSNLCRLITEGKLRGGRGEFVLEASDLAPFASGLILLSGCRKGEIPSLLLKGEKDKARDVAGMYLEMFGREDFFIELENHLYPEDRRLISELLSLSKALDIKYVATNNVHYAKEEGYRLHDVLLAIRHRKKVAELKELRLNSEFYLKSKEKMEALFSSLPSALSNTLLIASKCNVELDFSSFRFPRFPLEDGQKEEEYLKALCLQRLKEKYGDAGKEVEERFLYELELIKRFNLSGYFLIVWDIVEFAKRNGIPAQGRGSAANSLVAYLLGITKVDPIKNRLFLGRFLNEELSSIPDIDIDISTKERERVISYVYERYGPDRVAMVCTYVTFQARNAIREVGKALGFQKEIIDRMARSVSVYSARAIEEDLRRIEEYKRYFDSKIWQDFISLCRAIADFPRHISVHVGGMLISSSPLTELVPLERAPIGRIICQWDKDGVEDAGLVKVDLLGLRMLSLIEEARRLVERNYGIRLDMGEIPLDDESVFDMICHADTVGVFQLESRAQMQTLPRTRPRSIEDLTIQVAIIRPGPLQGNMVHPYIRRRNGLEEVTYLHPSLRPILEETLGVILFQEQILQVAVRIAGFKEGEAECLRRSMSRKRSKEEIEKMRTRFLKGALENGIEKSIADRIFEAVRGFAEYGFCKSHAAGFALLAYQSAWLKRYYPLEFYTALLNNQPMGFYRIDTVVNDAKRHGIEILHPHIGRSERDCTIEDGKIRLGLRYVKNLGERTIEKILKERGRGPYLSLKDFLLRVRPERDVVESLILAGAFDFLSAPKRRLLWDLAKEIEYGLPLSFEGEFELPDLTELEQVGVDYEILGISPSSHPLKVLRDGLSRKGFLKTSEILRLSHGEKVVFAGLSVVSQTPGTAKGFSFLTLEDEEGMINVVLRPQIYKRYRHVVRLEPFLLVEGRVERREGVTNIMAERIAALRIEE